MDLEGYKSRFDEESTPGWDAIDERLEGVYGGQEPHHWGTAIPYELGGPDPLDGISAYECRDGGVGHLHFVTYGYSNLYYDEKAVGGEFSRFGFEMTFRLAHSLPADPGDGVWVCNFLQNLACYVYDSGRWFEAGHVIPANGPIRTDSDTEIVGLVFLEDPTLPAIDTPHGRVDFVQGFGITQTEYEALRDQETTPEAFVESHRKANPLLVTDLDR